VARIEPGFQSGKGQDLFGVPGQPCHSSYFFRSVADGAPPSIDSRHVVLAADYFEGAAGLWNHRGGVNALWADGSASFIRVSSDFNIDVGSADDDSTALTAFNLLDAQ
jgi:prepilin-type processing-associated H-X9-DG protein